MHDPKPKPVQRAVSCRLLSSGSEQLSAAAERPSIDYFDVLESRRSAVPISDLTRSQLATLLWHSGRSMHTQRNANGILRQKRPYPSAGAIYEVEALVLRPFSNALSRYNAIAHSLEEVQADPIRLSQFKAERASIVGENGTAMLFAYHLCPLEAAYDEAQSLGWRDVGSIQVVFHLTATALGLRSTLFGILGSTLVESLSSSCGRYIGAGGLVVGS